MKRCLFFGSLIVSGLVTCQSAFAAPVDVQTTVATSTAKGTQTVSALLPVQGATMTVQTGSGWTFTIDPPHILYN